MTGANSDNVACVGLEALTLAGCSLPGAVTHRSRSRFNRPQSARNLWRRGRGGRFAVQLHFLRREWRFLFEGVLLLFVVTIPITLFHPVVGCLRGPDTGQAFLLLADLQLGEFWCAQY